MSGPDLATLPAELERVGVAGHLNGPPEPVDEATSTWVYFIRVDGAPLVLRVFRAGQSGHAEREHALAAFLAARGYPSPHPVACGDDLGPMGLPFVVQTRVLGIVAARAMASPRLRGVVRAMATIQAQLHHLPIVNCPLPDEGPVSTAYLRDDLDRRRRQIAATEPSDGLAWLHATAEPFTDRERVLCHGDFHPLNALVASDGAISIVDWSDARLGDPHFDVGRTLALYWIAPVVARNRVERVALRGLRGWLADTHRRAYERAAGRRLDDDLLAWWQAVHLYRGWLQLHEVAEGVVTGPETSTRAAFPIELADTLLSRFAALRARLG